MHEFMTLCRHPGCNILVATWCRQDFYHLLKIAFCRFKMASYYSPAYIHIADFAVETDELPREASTCIGRSSCKSFRAQMSIGEY